MIWVTCFFFVAIIIGPGNGVKGAETCSDRFHDPDTDCTACLPGFMEYPDCDVLDKSFCVKPEEAVSDTTVVPLPTTRPPEDGFPTICSGHGACGMHSAENEKPTVQCDCDDHFVGDYCDQCEVGAYGANCDPCPGGTNRPCSGHGHCDDGIRGSGSCDCFQGYAASSECETCAAGYERTFSSSGEMICELNQSACMVPVRRPEKVDSIEANVTVSKTSERESKDLMTSSTLHNETSMVVDMDEDVEFVICSGHGRCIVADDPDDNDKGNDGDGEGESAHSAAGGTEEGNSFEDSNEGVLQMICVCDVGWAGPLCEKCASGYYGEFCDLECPGGASQPCYGHGVCSSGRNGTGECYCQEGYNDQSGCRSCQAGYAGYPACRLYHSDCPAGKEENSTYCNHHGSCETVIGDSGSPHAVCSCDEHYVGSTCSECEVGRYGPDCLSCSCGHSLAHGECDDGITGSGTCRCAEGFDPETNCHSCVRGYTGYPNCREDHSGNEQLTSLGVALLMLSLAGCIMVIYFFLIFPQFHYFPDSSVSILLGILVGILVRNSNTDLPAVMSFNTESFFLIILPPIMFDAGYSLQKGNFFKNVGTILTFAVAGTVIAAFVIGLGVWLGGRVGMYYPFSLVDSLMFGSLLSAVDPVATIAIFQALDVNPTLHMLVFGESMLNDAVAIALFRTFSFYSVADDTSSDDSSAVAGEEIDTGTSDSEFSLWGPISIFLTVFLGSVFVGLINGVVSALVFKNFSLRDYPTLEGSMMFLFAYFPFVFCEGVGLSGILAILFTGMVMGHYTHFSLSPVSQTATQQLFRMSAFLTETFVFAYLGLSLPLMANHFQWGLLIWGIVLLLLSRASAVFPLVKLCNRFRRDKISDKDQIIIWFSGLRGAVSFALALVLPSDDDVKNLLVSATLGIVLFTIFFLGGLTYPLLKVLGADQQDLVISKTSEDLLRDETVSDGEGLAADIPLRGLSDGLGSDNSGDDDVEDGDPRDPFRQRRALGLSCLEALDQQFLQPWLRGSPPMGMVGAWRDGDSLSEADQQIGSPRRRRGRKKVPRELRNISSENPSLGSGGGSGSSLRSDVAADAELDMERRMEEPRGKLRTFSLESPDSDPDDDAADAEKSRLISPSSKRRRNGANRSGTTFFSSSPIIPSRPRDVQF
eukprot:Rmarinus@m.1453